MRSWFITGAAGGLGAPLARAVLDAGDNAVLTARDPDRLRSFVDTYGDRVLALPLDLARAQGQVDDAIAQAEARFGGIDVLVNNAGLVYFGAIEEGEDSSIRELFEVNVFGLAALTRAALPGMRARGNGTIVNVSSTSGLVAYPALGYYSASKFAVEGLTEALWQEVEPLGLKVILVEPGTFRTGINARSPRAAVREGCAPTARQMLDFLANAGETIEIGDPERAAAVILRAVTSGETPRRLLLGSDAYTAVNAKIAELRDELAAWEAVSKSTDFPRADAATSS